ncbi:MAG: hypothetical protein V5A88_08710 [Candidatus Thermoplasmatota archaeon]
MMSSPPGRRLVVLVISILLICVSFTGTTISMEENIDSSESLEGVDKERNTKVESYEDGERNVERKADKKSVKSLDGSCLSSPPIEENGWLYLYGNLQGINHRFTAENGVGVTDSAETDVWHGAMLLDLSNEVGDYLTHVAYYDYQDGGDWATAHVSKDDGGAPRDPWDGSSDTYTISGAGWVELELNAPVKIEAPGDYWIVMELHDYGDNYYPFGCVSDDQTPDDPWVTDGQYVNLDNPHDPTAWEDLETDYGIGGAFAVEVFNKDGYELTTESTAGGEVVDPGEGSYEYMDGTVVDLEAVADSDHRFVEWTGDTGTIADPTSAQTTITMDSDYTITAEFEVDTYGLTINSTEGGEVIQPGEGTFEYDNGEAVTLEAEAEEFHHFVEWTGDVGTIGDPASPQTTITMESDYTITAEFAIDTYDLAIDSTEGGEVIQPGENVYEYDHGTVVDIEAAADEDYLFVEWTGDTGTIADPISAQTAVTMEDDYTITAEFAQSRELTLDAEGDGSLEIDGVEVETPYSGEYPDRTDVELTAIPEDGWQFSHWTGDHPDGEQEEGEISVYMDGDKSLTAHFLEEFEFTVSVRGEGTTDPEPNTYIRLDGQEVTVEAVPDEGWQFSHWEGDVPEGQMEQETITIIVDSDKSLTAHFIEKFELTVEIAGEGVVEVDGDVVEVPWSCNYSTGTEVELAAVGEEGWRFVEWRGDHETSEREITITMDEDKSIIANFERIEYELIIEVEGDGSTYPGSGSHMYPYEEEVLVEAFPEQGWVFDGWTGDYTGEEENANITIDENKSLTANFLQKPYYEVELISPDDNEQFGTDDEIVVEFSVTNQGDLDGEKDVEFYVGDEYIDSKSDLSLGPGETQTKEFVWTPGEDGDFELEVRTVDDASESTISVEKRGITAHLWWILPLIAAVLIIALLLYRRKKDESEPPEGLSRKIEDRQRGPPPPPSKNRGNQGWKKTRR